MFFVPVAAPAYYPRRARRGPVFSPLELLDDGLLLSAYGSGHAAHARHDFPAVVADRELAEAILFAQQRHAMVEEQRRRELARHVQEIEEHERWVQHQLALRARREQLIRARREKVAEEQRRRQHAEAERALARALLFAHELAKHVQTEAEKPQPRVRFAPCHVRPAQPSTVPATSRPTVPPKPVLKNSPPAVPISSTASTPRTRVPVRLASSQAPPAAWTPSTSAPIRIPIRESKGKTSSHVRVTSHIPEPLPAGDAIAALSLLEADLDSISLTAGPAVMKHQLTRLLEQVDAVESNGHEAVRDVRRALVQRIEGALEALDSGNADEVKSPKEAGITIREAPKAARTPSPVPVPYVVDELLKPSSPEPTSSSPEPAVSAPAPEPYVVDDFLVASPASVAPVVKSPAPEGHVDPVQHFDDSTAPVESPAMDDFAAPPHASDELAVDVEVDGTVKQQQSSNDVEPSVSLPLDASDVVDIAPTPVSATSVQDTAHTPAPVQSVAPVENHAEPAAVAPTTAASTDATVARASPTPLAASYPPAQLFDTSTHPAVATFSPPTRASEASDVGSDWESARGSGSDGEGAFEVL
ncbi:hypothetical protein EXIGLDRAFT_841323 [Exidia glandulosa HHB12029]|uniref:BAG domain-containing protein n=1 Tax=Exidia glandulosa HHB12029 TaxID=1314781 RepID=A0A165DY53_EXIGL|nr:hypothetical protein EXIGLDRAFT_841323 [Exidia glandulosa HHB12029]